MQCWHTFHKRMGTNNFKPTVSDGQKSRRLRGFRAITNGSPYSALHESRLRLHPRSRDSSISTHGFLGSLRGRRSVDCMTKVYETSWRSRCRQLETRIKQVEALHSLSVQSAKWAKGNRKLSGKLAHLLK